MDFIREQFTRRNELSLAYFKQEAKHLALACQQMSERFLQGGRLLAFGKGAYTTDAQHVSVEFVHPVIVGKRALPALDISLAFKEWCNTLVQATDMVMGFAPLSGDSDMDEALSLAKSKGALTFAFSQTSSPVDYLFTPPSSLPFIHQELVEILYHTLWETVHVFFERKSNPSKDYDSGAASFLYPFLSGEGQDTKSILEEVAASVQTKVAEDVALRERILQEQADGISTAIKEISKRVTAGGKLIVFGNGGSATDANDFALDCIAPPFDWKPIPALSLALEPASLSAIANDVGVEVIFARQLIAHATSKDGVVAMSTSGGSRNVVMALEEARKRGLFTIALLGYDGGEVVRRNLADIPIVVRSDYIPRIQEVQASIYHVIREGVAKLSGSEAEKAKNEHPLQLSLNINLVELYGTASCPYTAELREDLEWRGIEFVEYDVDEDSGARSRLLSLTSQRTVPVLVENGKVTHIGWQGRGCVIG